MSDQDSIRPPRELARRGAIDVFIVLYLIAIWSWSMPGDYALAKRAHALFEPWLIGSGLWQHWNMFSPNPRNFLVVMEAEVFFQNGEKAVWEFPRMERLGRLERYRKERFRKWANDNVREDKRSILWAPTARFVARQFLGRSSPPKLVKLTRRWANVPPPPKGLFQRIPQPPFKWQQHAFFSYQVRPEDLK